MPLASISPTCKLIKPAPAQTESPNKSNHLHHYSPHAKPTTAADFCSDISFFIFIFILAYLLSMSGQARGDRTVKVVIINTKYVETDAMSFKDVVQNLTGKDSRVAYEVQELPPVTNTNKNTTSQFSNFRDQGLMSGRYSMTNSNSNPTGLMPRSNSSIMMRNISFKEFDSLFREMPPMEEFWTDLN